MKIIMCWDPFWGSLLMEPPQTSQALVGSAARPRLAQSGEVLALFGRRSARADHSQGQNSMQGMI